MPIVTIQWAEGRTIEQKRQVIEGVTRVVSEAGKVDKSGIIVMINDWPFTNFGVGGEQRTGNHPK